MQEQLSFQMGVATPVCVYTALICYSLLAEASLQASLIPNRTIIAGESFRLRCTVSTEGYTMKLVWNGKTVGQTTNTYLEKFVASAEETGDGPFACITQRGDCSASSSVFVSIEGTVIQIGTFRCICSMIYSCSSSTH